MKFRKKPVVIDAVQWTDATRLDVMEFVGSGALVGGDVLVIDTLEGQMTAQKGDWIIKGVQGEFYPCKPDIFAETYEAVEE